MRLEVTQVHKLMNEVEKINWALLLTYPRIARQGEEAES